MTSDSTCRENKTIPPCLDFYQLLWIHQVEIKQICSPPTRQEEFKSLETWAFLTASYSHSFWQPVDRIYVLESLKESKLFQHRGGGEEQSFEFKRLKCSGLGVASMIYMGKDCGKWDLILKQKFPWSSVVRT